MREGPLVVLRFFGASLGWTDTLGPEEPASKLPGPEDREADISMTIVENRYLDLKDVAR